MAGETCLFANSAKVIAALVAVVGVTVITADCGLVHANEPLNPVALLQKIKTTGPDAVYKKDLTGELWITLLKKIETGERSWLEVAAAIYPATDGGSAYELTLAAAVALARNPRDVLLLTASRMSTEGVCGFPDMADAKTDTQQKVVAYLDARINAVNMLTGPDVAALRMQCLQTLENTKREVLSPKGPFS